ncbi:MAG: hypothetical protein ACHQAV_03165 [Solirubrobacterales bacterium]
MSKQRASKSRVKSTVGAVPWAVLLRGGAIVGKRWTALSAKERAQVAQLVRESRGRVSNLSAKQRTELRKLARRLDLKGMGRELLPLVRGGARTGRRRASRRR